MRKRALVLVFLLAYLFAITFGDTYANQENEKQRWYEIKEIDYEFDFEEKKLSFYLTHEALIIEDRANMEIKDGRLYAKGGKSFRFGSSVCLGDSYGLEDGFLEFDMLQKDNKGELVLGIRLQRVSATEDKPGIWLSFKAGKLVVGEKESGITASIDIPVETNKVHKYKINDNRNEIEILIDDNVVAKILYDAKGYLAFTDKSDNVIDSTEESKIYPTGYFNIIPRDFYGYLDNLKFRHVEVDETLPEGPMRDVDYSYWVASDDLGRTTPTYDKVGELKEDKYVGIFYFICVTGAGLKVQDNTKIYLERGIDGLKQYLETQGGEGYWAEPYFGYYRNTDAWVYRKHAYMLSAAGIDFIFIDISNEPTFNEAHTLLFDTWLQMRKEGFKTPQIMFLTGDTEGRLGAHMRQLRRTVYSDENWEKYEELFFKWEGKPLIFGNPEGLTGDMQALINEKFTLRSSWAWKDEDGYWNWIMEYPQAKGRSFEGVFEQMAVTMGHHPSASKGRSFVSGKQPNNGKEDFEFSSDTARYGLSFKQQFEYALEMDPQVIMITGWNEWIAGKPTGDELNYFANTPVNGYTYVDQFNPEFSRDGEPMKIRDGVGFGDNFYYQMVGYIRKFKGLNEIEKAKNQKTININGGMSQWDDIGPEFRDTIGDTKFRNEPSYDLDFRYINNTGRNDFDYAKVSQDNENIYFMVKTVNDIVHADGPNWMNLFIDLDQSHKTGWEGYDYIINRTGNNGKCTIERFKNNSWDFEKVGEARYTVNGQYMMVSVPKKALGISDKAVSFDFKWADNSTTSGDVMQFMDLGDAAPNDRFKFRYIASTSIFDNLINTILIIGGAVVLLVVVSVIVFVLFRRRKKRSMQFM